MLQQSSCEEHDVRRREQWTRRLAGSDCLRRKMRIPAPDSSNIFHVELHLISFLNDFSHSTGPFRQTRSTKLVHTTSKSIHPTTYNHKQLPCFQHSREPRRHSTTCYPQRLSRFLRHSKQRSQLDHLIRILFTIPREREIRPHDLVLRSLY